jgi:CheY-like chemotaxis protein
MRFVAKKSNKSGALHEVSEKRAQLGLPQLPQGADFYSHDLAVLVLNEEADVLDEVATMLRRRGLTVHLAGSATEARSMMMTHPEIGVMLADICPLEGEALQLAANVLAGKAPLPALDYRATVEDLQVSSLHAVSTAAFYAAAKLLPAADGTAWLADALDA